MTSVLRFVAPACAALVLTACASSRVPEDGVMGNTNWLASCESSDECEDGTQCVCGMCTLACESSDECAELAGGVCDSSSDALARACGDALPEDGLCLPECSDSAPCGDGQRCVDDHCLPQARVVDPSDDGGTCFAAPTCAESEDTYESEELCQEQSDDCREASICGVSVWCAEVPINCAAEPSCDEGETRYESADACEATSEVCRDVSLCGSTVWCGSPLITCDASPLCQSGEFTFRTAEECEQGGAACRLESTCGRTIWCAAPCAPQLVDFTDECSFIALRYYWNGFGCIDSGGCTCEGPDCEAGVATLEECVEAFSGCPEVVACGGFAGDTCQDDEYCAYIPAQDNCGALDGMATCRPRPDACEDVYEPVCGCDNETYGNACEAASAGMGLTAFGECP